MARHVRQPSSRLAGAPAPTGKSLLSSVITEHRATLPALHLEATREERYVQLDLIHRLTTHCTPQEKKKALLNAYY